MIIAKRLFTILSVIIFFQCWQLSVFAQLALNKPTIAKVYDSLQTLAPREKLYVHFDKSTYALTDTIWFKGYLVGASQNSYSTYSGLIYTELINSNTGEVVQRLSLPTAMGLTWGSFAINPEKFTAGNYTFRAYTNWMQNFGPTHFFKKDIQLVSFSGETFIKGQKTAVATSISSKTDSTRQPQSKDIDIQFLPEGGRYMPGISHRIAFKAIDASGKGVQVSGEILDSKQNIVQKFQSNTMGMGYFHILAAANENYSAVVKYGNTFTNAAFPRQQQDGTALMVNNSYHRDSVRVTLYSNNPSDQEMSLIGQSRGLLSFSSTIRFNTPIKFIQIPKSAFPTGVCQILLVDAQGRTLNQRNFFIDRKEGLKLELNVPDTIFAIRDSIPLEVSVADALGKPIEGSFSIAVTDDNQVAKDPINDANIISYLLLSSDLKGEIEKPGYYFYQTNEQLHNELDALMLTQGWVSYDWDLSKKPTFRMEKEYAINGRVYGLFQKPMKNAKMTLLGKNRGMLMMDTIANEKGEFTFRNLPLLDSASFVIQAHNKKDKKGSSTIEIEEFKVPIILIPKKNKVMIEQPLDSITENFVNTKKEEVRLVAKDGIMLKEVGVVGKRVIRGSKNLNGPGEADLTITEEELNKVAKKTLFELLQEKIPGFRHGVRTIPHPKDFLIDGRMLKFIIDGIYLDFYWFEEDDYYYFIRQYLDNYNAEDIRGIELMDSFKYSFTYGSEYLGKANELIFIEVTTRTGAGPFLKKSPNLYLYRPINYGDTKVFYSPKYTAANKADKKPDFRSTIYWNPNLMTDAKGNAQTYFFSADKKGTYTVWIEGSDMQGNFGMRTLKLNIK